MANIYILLFLLYNNICNCLHLYFYKRKYIKEIIFRRSVWTKDWLLPLVDSAEAVEEGLDRCWLNSWASSAMIRKYLIELQKRADWLQSCLKLMMRSQQVHFYILLLWILILWVIHPHLIWICLFLAQFDTIKKLASEESCIIVGRCADYALSDDPNAFSVFITGDDEDKIRRIMETNNIEANKAKDIMIKTDKKRSSYYNYYSSKRWADSRSYDLTINSTTLGLEGSVELIKTFAKIKGLL